MSKSTKSASDKAVAEKAEADRLAAEKAEADRLAAEKAEADRLAAEKAEADRLAAEKAEADRLAADTVALSEYRATAHLSENGEHYKPGESVQLTEARAIALGPLVESI